MLGPKGMLSLRHVSNKTSIIISVQDVVQGGSKAAAGGDQIGNKKGTDSNSDGGIPVKAIAEGIVTPNTATDIDSSGIHTVPGSAQQALSACHCTQS